MAFAVEDVTERDQEPTKDSGVLASIDSTFHRGTSIDRDCEVTRICPSIGVKAEVSRTGVTIRPTIALAAEHELQGYLGPLRLGATPIMYDLFERTECLLSEA